jgi:hypothetical protein
MRRQEDAMTTTTAVQSFTRPIPEGALSVEATTLRQPMLAVVTAAAALLWLVTTLLVLTGTWQPPIPGPIGGIGRTAATKQITSCRG